MTAVPSAQGNAIENIFWKTRTPRGVYQVFVVNYARDPAAGFNVIVSGGGERTFDGTTQQEARVFDFLWISNTDEFMHTGLPGADGKPKLAVCKFEFGTPSEPIKWLETVAAQPEECRQQAEAQLHG